MHRVQEEDLPVLAVLLTSQSPRNDFHTTVKIRMNPWGWRFCFTLYNFYIENGVSDGSTSLDKVEHGMSIVINKVDG